MKDVEKWFDKLPSSTRAVKVAVAFLIVLVFGLFGVLFWQVHQNSQVAASNAAVARARGQALGTANAKLTQNGIPAVKPTDAKATPGQTDVGPTTPSSTPKAERGRQGETGAQGPGPTMVQVEQAVDDYCGEHKGCKGGPTQAQVAAAVLTFCDKHSDCQGKQGATGERGLPGATVTGPSGASGAPGKDATGDPGPSGASGAPGRAPTSDEISAAVAAYCADGACRGAKGDTGSKGDPGSAGRDGTDAPHFTKIECAADNTWQFTLSDGSTLTAAGPCRAATSTVTTTVTEPPTSEPSSTATP